jgi:hypothetical protein
MNMSAYGVSLPLPLRSCYKICIVRRAPNRPVHHCSNGHWILDWYLTFLGGTGPFSDSTGPSDDPIQLMVVRRKKRSSYWRAHRTVQWMLRMVREFYKNSLDRSTQMYSPGWLLLHRTVQRTTGLSGDSIGLYNASQISPSNFLAFLGSLPESRLEGVNRRNL